MMQEALTIWFIAGLVLILLEFVVPGVILVFFGVAAWVVALGMWLGVIESLSVQCAVFWISSLLMIFLLRRFVTSWFVGRTLNNGANVDDEFVGKKVIVVQAIGGGDDIGKVELKGAQWSASCNIPLDIGSHATIIERDGINLTVKPSK